MIENKGEMSWIGFNLNQTKEKLKKTVKKTMIIQETLASPVIIIIATNSVSAKLV